MPKLFPMKDFFKRILQNTSQELKNLSKDWLEDSNDIDTGTVLFCLESALDHEKEVANTEAAQKIITNALKQTFKRQVNLKPNLLPAFKLGLTATVGKSLVILTANAPELTATKILQLLGKVVLLQNDFSEGIIIVLIGNTDDMQSENLKVLSNNLKRLQVALLTISVSS